jgi:hypothetical protein
LDPSGNITVRTLSNAPSTAGSFDVKWNFILDKPAEEDGYIVQKVTLRYNFVRLGPRGNVTDRYGPNPNPTVYWEAWFVKQGNHLPDQALVDGNTDEAKGDPHPGTSGQISMDGEIRFYTRCGVLGNGFSNPKTFPDPETGFGIGKVPWSLTLPSTDKKPFFWERPSNDLPIGKRSVQISWHNTPFDGVRDFDGDNNSGFPNVSPQLNR